MNQVQMASKLYECRDACIKLWGKQWIDHIRPYIALVNSAMIRHKTDNPIETALHLIDENKADDSNSGIFLMKLLAATVEIIEPISHDQ